MYDVKLKQNKGLPQLGPQTVITGRRPKVPNSTRLSGNPSGNSVSQNATNSNSQSQKSDREIDLHDAQDITDMRTGYDPVEAKVSRSPCTGSGIFGLSRINFT